MGIRRMPFRASVRNVHKHVTLFFFALLCYDEAGILLFSTAFREKHVILCFRFPLDGVDYRQHVVGVVIR